MGLMAYGGCTVPFVIGECHHAAAATFDDRFVPFFMALRVTLWPQNAQPEMSFVLSALRCLQAVSFNCATKDDALKVCAAFNLALKSMPHKHVICVSCTLCRVRDVLATGRARVCLWVCVCVGLRVRQRRVVSRGLPSGQLKA